MMIKKLSIALVLLFVTTYGFSQDSTAAAPEKIRDVFGGTLLIENQTTTTPLKGGKQFIIQHRFSKIDDISDLYGLYGSSNIRLAVNYGITSKIMAGFGTERYNKLQEFYWKYNFLSQKTKGMPFSLAYFGNISIDGRKKSLYGDNFKSSDRLSFFNELILTRKFGERVSLELAGGYSHINKVENLMINDTTYRALIKNDAFCYTFGGRVKIYNEMSLIFEYDYPFISGVLQEQQKPKQNYAFGFELGTGTHVFQVFATTWDKLNQEYNYSYGVKNFPEDLMLGFNITVKL